MFRRWLLIGCLILPNVSFSALAAGTLALYHFENNGTDSSTNGYDLTNVGSVPFVTSPAYAGTYSSGTFTNTRRWLEPAGMTTALTGLTNFTIEGYVYFNALDGGVESWFTSSAADCGVRVLATGAARLVYKAAFADSSAGAITTGAWYYFAYVHDSTSCRLYMSLASSISQSVLLTVADGSALGTVANFNFGDYYVTGLPLAGYIDDFRVSNVARSSFPTVDTTGNTTRTMKLKLVERMRLH